MQMLERTHPLILMVYMAGILILSMLALEPVYVMLSFLGALVFGACVRWWCETFHFIRWQPALVAVIALANLLFSSSGSTELFRIGVRAFYLESLVFGLCMGVLLVAILLWFWDFSSLLTSEKVEAVLGNVAPVLAIMITMIARLIPQFVRQGEEIDEVQRACSAAQAQAHQPTSQPPFRHTSSRHTATRHTPSSFRFRQISVLMGWTLEDSLETAQAMKARGWGYARKRTTYERYVFKKSDAVCLLAAALLFLACGVAVAVAGQQFHFYPTLSVVWSIWYAFAAVLFCVPTVVVMRGRV